MNLVFLYLVFCSHHVQVQGITQDLALLRLMTNLTESTVFIKIKYLIKSVFNRTNEYHIFYNILIRLTGNGNPTKTETNSIRDSDNADTVKSIVNGKQ